MTPTPIVCANCGAQYRLPETFQAAQARCKKCGATMDVAAQRANPEAATPPTPPKAASTPERPVTGRRAERSTRSSRSGRPAAAETPAGESAARGRVGSSRGRMASGSARRRGKDDSDAGSGSRDRRGRGDRGGDEKKSNAALWIVTSVAALGVLVALYFFVFAGSQEPKNPNVADATTPPATDPATVGDAAVQPNDQTALNLGEAATAGGAEIGNELKGEAKPAEAAASKDEPATPAPAKEEPKPGPKPKEDADAAKNAPTSPDQVYDPKASLQPIERPEWIDEQEWQEAADAVDAMQSGGLAGIRGKTKLEKLANKAVPAIVNKLRTLDYTKNEDNVYAYELNRLLTVIGGGVMNADFHAQQVGEPVSLADADWNAKTVIAWQKFYERHCAPEDYKKMIQNIRNRNVNK